jgi:Ferritin-like domain
MTVWTRRRAVAAASFGLTSLLLGERGVAAAGGKASEAGDRSIFRFALQLELLQLALYRDALAHAGLRGELREFGEVVGGHEAQHVAAVAKAAGASPSPARYDFGASTRNASAFAHAARVVEDLGVAAYNAQLANLTDPGMTLAARIVSVEGRHAAWIRDLVGLAPAPRPVDPGATARRIGAEIAALDFRRKP